jgi:putative ABC transport system permease protein
MRPGIHQKEIRMQFEIRMAWRETRPAIKRFLFLVVAIALGVGALTGLKGFSRALDRSISRSARDLLAADLAVRFNSLPNQNEIAVLESLVQKGAVLTRTTETLSMVSHAGASVPILSSIRAVDPQSYPFYGNVELEPSMLLRKALADDAAVAGRDLLTRFGISVGDLVQIGNSRFRISAVLKSEPDRIGFGMDLGPRILITRKGLDRSGLIQFGSRASELFLFQLPSRGLNLEEARNIIDSGISRRIRITDYRDPNPSVSRGLERTANFLSLIGLLSLIVGGLGVSTTIHTYLQQKLDSIAVIKCLGGQSRQIINIYLLQGLVLGVLGSALGVGLGYLVQLLLPQMLKGLISLPTQLEPAPGAAIQGFIIGIFMTFIFLITPLLAIRKIRPIRVFLREMPETQLSTLRRLRHDPLPLASSLLLLLGIGLAASWLAESFRWGIAFLSGLVACILILALAARILLFALKKIPPLPSLAIRQGLKNLNRPGNHVSSIMVALGLGVAFILAVYFIQTSLISQIVKSAPADFPNVFLLGITETDKQAITGLLKSQRGITDRTLVSMFASHLSKINGKTIDQLGFEPHEQRYFQMEFSLTWNESVPPDTRIVEGKWWHPPYDSPLISVGENAAQHLKIHLGDSLDFDIGGMAVRGTVMNIRDVEFSRPGTSNQFIFSPGSLDGFSASYIGTVRIDPSRVVEFQSALYRQFPNVTSIDIGQVLTRVQDLLNKISVVIRFVAFFAIISGIIILAAGVISTRHQRIREVVLLKTLGATRPQISRIQAAEFLIVGSAAGLVGGILAAIAAHYLLGELLQTEFEFRWLPLLASAAATAVLSIITGWLASQGVLNHKPLEILREN